MRMKYLLLLMLAVLLFVLTGCAFARKAENKAEYTRISQEEAKEMMTRDDGHVIVDVLLTANANRYKYHQTKGKYP